MAESSIEGVFSIVLLIAGTVNAVPHALGRHIAGSSVTGGSANIAVCNINILLKYKLIGSMSTLQQQYFIL